MSELAIAGGPQAAGALRIPAWPVLTDEDREAVRTVLDSRHWGRLHARSQAAAFEQAFAEYHDARYAVAVNNGTVALELALLAAGIRPGDQVLVPAVTFIATAAAVVRVGAIPIFVDSDPETLSISPAAVEAAITPRTRAIIAVHYGGYPVDLDALVPLAARHDLVLIEDCAHAQGSAWRGRKVGGYGYFGTFSFQQSKSLTAGEGGIVLADDEGLAAEARLLHDIGRRAGLPDYEHLILASNYRISDLSAALLLSQLGRLQEQVEQRAQGAGFLADGLEAVGGIRMLKADPRITQRGYYFLVLRYPRDQFGGVPLPHFIQALRAEGVPCGSGYGMPLYRQPAFRREYVAQLLGRPVEEVPDYAHMSLPVADHFCAEEQITLPHPLLMASREDLQRIVDAVAKLKENVDELRASVHGT